MRRSIAELRMIAPPPSPSPGDEQGPSAAAGTRLVGLGGHPLEALIAGHLDRCPGCRDEAELLAAEDELEALAQVRCSCGVEPEDCDWCSLEVDPVESPPIRPLPEDDPSVERALELRATPLVGDAVEAMGRSW